MSDQALGRALRAARQRLAAIDAQVLLSHVTGRDAAYLIAHAEARLSEDDERAYAELVERRAAGEPVAYLTGEREFYGLSFKVTPDVLIPRPETELLVEIALERIPANRPARVVDLGTGSGCVAISIASKRLHSEVLATDQSLAALAVARENAAALEVANVRFRQSDWYSGLEGERFDTIVANPPYVASGDPQLEEGDLRFEPRHALEAGPHGLDSIRQIVIGARSYLAPGGWVLFEHSFDQGAASRELLVSNGYVEIFTARDLARLERVTGGRLTLAGSGR